MHTETLPAAETVNVAPATLAETLGAIRRLGLTANWRSDVREIRIARPGADREAIEREAIYAGVGYTTKAADFAEAVGSALSYRRALDERAITSPVGEVVATETRLWIVAIRRDGSARPVTSASDWNAPVDALDDLAAYRRRNDGENYALATVVTSILGY